MRSAYVTLGLPGSASSDQIQRAYAAAITNFGSSARAASQYI